MKSIKVLDVTLRDGGCVNNFDFGQAYMDRILKSLEESGVDFIELGYIDEKNGSPQGRTQFNNEQVISQYFLKNKKPGVTYVAMMDYGKFDVDRLQPRTADGIDGIRVAFHKKNRTDVIEVGRKIMEKGYQFYVQPMITMRYSDSELLELIDLVNKELPQASGFYIVDSFGEMRANDLTRILNLVDHNLLPSMTIGFHSHNNLQLSYSNAMALLQFPCTRNLMLDSAVMGMGKGAGNLNTELLVEHLNLYYGKQYQVAPLLALIDQVIEVIHQEFYWGYSVEYYLSSVNHCTSSYAGHFYNKHMLPIDQVAELLSMIEEDKKISFDKKYAEELYQQYNMSKSYQDDDMLKELKKKLENKIILLIAPGKSISKAKNIIEQKLNQDQVISISLNNFAFSTDFILTTRIDSFQSAKAQKRQIIVPSNICREAENDIYIVDYKKWVVVQEGTQDSSGVVALNLLCALGVKQVLMAGFDGFSVDINENYYNKSMRHTVSYREAETKNTFFSKYIQEMRKKVDIRFLTPTRYDV